MTNDHIDPNGTGEDSEPQAPGQPYGQQYGQPYGQPQVPPQTTPQTPQYGQPSYGQPGYSQPGYGQPNAGGPNYGQPAGAPMWQQAGPTMGAAPDTMVPPLNKPYYGCPPQEAVTRFFRKYVVFSGRASRSEFWWAILGYVIVSVVLSWLGEMSRNGLDWLSSLWSLATFLPMLAVLVRRLHDSNRSGWWAALPSGLSFAGLFLVLIGAAQFIFGLGSAFGMHTGSSDWARTIGIGALIWILLAVLCWVASLISWIIFATASSNPAGARFDDDAQPAGMPPYQYGGYPQGPGTIPTPGPQR